MDHRSVVPLDAAKRWWQPGILVFGIMLVAFLVSWRVSRRPPGRQNIAGTLQARRPVYGFGDVTPAQMPTAIFRLCNRSGENVNIAGLVPSCWCLSARCPLQVLVPGEAVDVQVTFDASLYSDYQGPFSKYISVLYRTGADARLRVLRLFVKGNIADDAPLFAYPSTVDVGNVTAGAAVRSTVYLRGWGDVLKAIPPAVVLHPGSKRFVRVGPDLRPAPNLDREMIIIIKIPVSEAPGRFKSRAMFTFKGFSPVLITIKGTIGPENTAHPLVGNGAGAQAR